MKGDIRKGRTVTKETKGLVFKGENKCILLSKGPSYDYYSIVRETS